METDPIMVTVEETVTEFKYISSGDHREIRTTRTWKEPLDSNKPTEDEEDNDGEDVDPGWFAQGLKKLGFTQI